MRVLLVALVLGAALTGAAAAAPLKIFTQWKGPGLVLDVVNGGDLDGYVHLMPAGNYSGQAWTMTPAGDGTFRLTTEFRGPKMCLEAMRLSKKDPAATLDGKMDGFLKLTPCGNVGGQYWTMEQAGDWVRLRPQFYKLCVDVVNGGELDGFAHMAECGDYAGQYWKME